MSLQLDPLQSVAVAQRIEAKTQNCFEQAYQAVLLLEQATYVQGFLVIGSQPVAIIEHSWVEQDCIIDPNLPQLNCAAEQLWYFPAHRLSRKQLTAAVEEANEDYPEDNPLPVYGAAPYEYYGEVMLGGQEYLTAYQAAEAKFKALR